MNLNRELGLKSPSRYSNMSDNMPMDPIEPEFQDAAIDIENIVDEGAAKLGSVAEDAIEKGKEIGGLVLGEAKSAANALTRSSQRLDSNERVFSFIPNSLLVYGGLALAIYYFTKK